jgi:feruloyl-CoA synthase
MTVERGAYTELFAEPRILREDLPGGGMILRSEVQLPPLPRSTGEWLRRWAAEAPERVFLAERAGQGAWRRIGYRETYASARAIGQALLDRGLGPHRPVMILS